MYKITAPYPIGGEGWGLQWENGVTETNNEGLALKLQQRGYKVEKYGAATDTAANTAIDAAARNLNVFFIEP